MGLEKKADELIEAPGQASSELVIQDLMDRDERIDLLIHRLETKYDRGNELQSRLEMLSLQIKEQRPYWQRSSLQERVDEASEELERLSDEVVVQTGIPYWTTDIGGFGSGDTTSADFRELVVRWFQWGAFCPLFRLHGARSGPPWPPGRPSQSSGSAAPGARPPLPQGPARPGGPLLATSS